MPKIAYLCLGGPKYGFGHLNRALIFNDHFNKKKLKIKINIIIDSFERYNFNLKKGKINFVNYNIFNIKKLLNKNYDYIFVDILNNNFLKKKRNKIITNFFFKFSLSKLFIFDTVPKFSIAKFFSIPKNAILITPYLFNNNHNDSFIRLNGLKYYVFPKNLKKKTYLKINPKNILITVGGSDHKNILYTILKNISFKNTFKYKIIIGPFFKKKYIQKIEKITKLINNASLIYQPNSLYQYLNWSDIVISASGLTKYEITYSKVISIMFSIDEDHHLINKDFERLKSSLYIGQSKNLIKINTYLHKLIESYDLRKKIFNQCKNIVDDKGFHRIYKYIK